MFNITADEKVQKAKHLTCRSQVFTVSTSLTWLSVHSARDIFIFTVYKRDATKTADVAWQLVAITQLMALALPVNPPFVH